MRRAVIVILLFAGCRETPAGTPPRKPPNEHAAWMKGKPAGCGGLTKFMLEQAGPDAVDCNKQRNNAAAIHCANDAFRNRRPFVICSGEFGMDSYLSTGVAGTPDGNLMVFDMDTLGPAYRGSCLRQNVAIGPEGWPDCKKALTNMTDLRTKRPYHERGTIEWEEPWPPSCATAALQAKRVAFPPRAIAHPDPITAPERWGLTCRGTHPHFELLIARDGSVACARIINVINKPSPPGINDEIRANLMKWRFQPPKVNGEPVEMVWGMQFNMQCR